MFQAIAEVVKQAMRNVANSGKNAQVNGSTASGSVGLIAPNSKKTDSNSDSKEVETEAQTTEDTTKAETVKQEKPVEEGDDSSSGSGGMSLSGLGSITNMGGGSSGGGIGGMIMSDKKMKESKDVSTGADKFQGAKDTAKKLGENLKSSAEAAKIQGSVAPFNPINSQVVSDERLKDIFGEDTPIECFSKIHAYEFKYTPQAQEIMGGEAHVDNKEHFGVMAQELLENPKTSSCVVKDDNGFLRVDTAMLTMANTAVIGELSRKIQQLEQMLGER